MANRQAIKDLQVRLAERLHAARTEAVVPAWLAVLVGQANYLLPLTQSGEIFPLAVVNPVPYTQPWFLGVANLRGGLYGVVDLGQYMGLAGARSERALPESWLVTLNLELELNCAVMVDGLVGLRRQDAFAHVEPAKPDAPVFFGRQFLDAQGGSWQEIDLRALSQMPRFLSIGV